MIRPYQTTDREELLALLQLNIPKYFAPSEAADFVEYLDLHREDYFVFEEGGKIIGSGGINYGDEGTQARLSWDFVHPEQQRRGIGKQLTRHRIDEIKKKPKIVSITVRTSQLAFPFYQKLGFDLQQVEKDFWAEGFDLYQMTMSLER